MRVLTVLKTNLINRIRISEILSESNKKGKRIFIYISSLLLCTLIICTVYFQVSILNSYTQYEIYLPKIIKSVLAIFFIINYFWSVRYVIYSETNLSRLLPLPLTTGQVMFIKSLEIILFNIMIALLFLIPVSLSMHFTKYKIIIFFIYCVVELTMITYNVVNVTFLLLFNKGTLSGLVKVIAAIILLGNISLLIYMTLFSNDSGLILGLGIAFSIICYYLSVKKIENSYLLLVERNRKKEKTYKVEISNLSVEKAMFLKELKMYLSDKFYMLNSSFGALMLIVFSAVIVTIPIDSLIQYNSFSISCIYSSIPVIFAMIISTCCITYCTFSLEGKNLWILQKAPVTINQIVRAKVSVNLVVSVPCILISSLIVFIFRRNGINLFIVAMCLVLPILSSLYISLFGCLIDLRLCNLDWENAQMLIKRSKTYPITLLSGMLPSMICESCVILLAPKLGEILIYSMICVIFMVAIFVIWLFIKKSQKRFNKINKS